jgi:hypothetical protein
MGNPEKLPDCSALNLVVQKQTTKETKKSGNFSHNNKPKNNTHSSEKKFRENKRQTSRN